MVRLRLTFGIGCLCVLAACASPYERVPKLEDVELAEDAPRVDALEAAAAADEPIVRPGLFSTVLRGVRNRGSNASAPDTNAAVAEALATDAPASAEEVAQSEPATTLASAAPEADAKPKRRGLFGLGAGFGAPSSNAATQRQPGPVKTAAVAKPPSKSETTTPRRGLFGLGGAKAPPKSNEPDVTPGAPLAFGAVGRVCGLSKRDLGREVERFPKLSRRGAYTLYDTSPGSTSARAFYITGFADGCPRQVTAANVVFGAPSMHERLRYGLPSDTLPSSRTDDAYKQLKSRICRVPRSAPCGDAIGKLERNTVFVTMYANFSGNKNWSNLLLHNGGVYAKDAKS